MVAFSRPSSSATSERRMLLVAAALLPCAAEAGWWHITGPCQTSAGDSSCVVSPGFPYNNYGNSQSCTMRWMSTTGEWYLQVASFNTESCCDKIRVNGRDYSGTGSDLVAARPSLWGDVTWTADSTVTRSGWKLCARQQSTAVWSVSGPCPIVSSEPECVTSPYWPSNYGNSQSCTMRIANGRSMYLQSASFYTESNFDHLDWNGNSYSGGGGSNVWRNSALWSSVSWTTDSTVQKKGWKICARDRSDVYWNVAGPCTAVAGQPHCVTSPHWPSNYDSGEACTMSVPNHGGLYLHTISFNTESSFDHLTVNGNRYSGSGSGLVGNAVYFSGDVTWTTDGTVTRSGWKICASTSYSSISSSAAAELEPAALELVTAATTAAEGEGEAENEEPAATNKTAAVPPMEIEGLTELLAAGASAEDGQLMAKLKRTTAKSEMMETTTEMETETEYVSSTQIAALDATATGTPMNTSSDEMPMPTATATTTQTETMLV